MFLGRCLEISDLVKWLNMSIAMMLLVEWTQTDSFGILSHYSMKYGAEFEACEITFTMLMLYFKHFPGNSVY